MMLGDTAKFFGLDNLRWSRDIVEEEIHPIQTDFRAGDLQWWTTKLVSFRSFSWILTVGGAKVA